LLECGFDAFGIGVFVTITLLGSAIATLCVGTLSRRFGTKGILLAASVLMVATGLGVLAFPSYWPLMVIGLIGTLNPSGGDVTVFLPLDHTLLVAKTEVQRRAHRFAQYSMLGALGGAMGAISLSGFDRIAGITGLHADHAPSAAFMVYAMIGAVVFALYQRYAPGDGPIVSSRMGALGASRRPVYFLAALFSIDSFGGGFLIQSFLVLFLHERFDLSAGAAGGVFFLTGLLGAMSQFVAAWLGARIGLINTMVFTHIPAGLCAMALPFAPNLEMALGILFLRASLQQMDVPVRSALVMAMVTPPERAAAAALTNVPRSLAAAFSPALAGWLFSSGNIVWPFAIGGAIKIAYDLILFAKFTEPVIPSE
jgi:predicted MFS family arabinose efflux permease